jgi:hypothetical protein
MRAAKLRGRAATKDYSECIGATKHEKAICWIVR